MGDIRHRMAVMAHRQPTAADDPDFFPTPPWGARAGAELVRRLDPAARVVWECASGAGHMAHGLRDYFPVVRLSDAYAYDGEARFDFLSDGPGPFEADWIITNPPFAPLEAFVRAAWPRARRGVAMLMRAGALESIGRYSLLYRDCPLTVFAPFSERLPMHRARWEPDGSSAAFYAWFLFCKPVLRPARFMARVGGDLYPATVPIPPGTEARLTRPSDAALFGVVDRSEKAGERRRPA